ncbi:MAG TPA: hypothetical protein PK867_10415 [Pirellulales bacterium]|nr:hypothetical protein [Pirellulales bacterium]
MVAEIQVGRVRAKPPLLYWFWRVYCPSVYVAFVIIGCMAISKQNTAILGIVFGYAPLFVIVVFAFLNLGAFPFAYSVFGKYRRSAFPPGPAIREIGYSWGYVGRLRSGPGLRWLLYHDGIGINIGIIGAAFIPLKEIDAIEFDGWWTATIMHHCPEVRGPIKAPIKVARIMAHYYAEKVRSSD